MIRLTTENSSLFTQHTFLDFAFRQSIFPLFAGSSLVRAIVWSKLTDYPSGLSVTTAMIEMATRHIISGTTRMFYAVLIAIELGFGIAVGAALCISPPSRHTY